MSSPLRTLARHRWQQNAEHRQRREAMRRMWTLFFLALAVTLCGLLTIKIVAQHVTERDRTAIEGALHGE
jgi:FtsH-binding integral membrane protein